MPTLEEFTITQYYNWVIRDERDDVKPRKDHCFTGPSIDKFQGRGGDGGKPYI